MALSANNQMALSAAKSRSCPPSDGGSWDALDADAWEPLPADLEEILDAIALHFKRGTQLSRSEQRLRWSWRASRNWDHTTRCGGRLRFECRRCHRRNARTTRHTFVRTKRGGRISWPLGACFWPRSPPDARGITAPLPLATSARTWQRSRRNSAGVSPPVYVFRAWSFTFRQLFSPKARWLTPQTCGHAEIRRAYASRSPLDTQLRITCSPR